MNLVLVFGEAPLFEVWGCRHMSGRTRSSPGVLESLPLASPRSRSPQAAKVQAPPQTLTESPAEPRDAHVPARRSKQSKEPNVEMSDNEGVEAAVVEAVRVADVVDAVESDEVTGKANGEPMDDNDDADDAAHVQVKVEKQLQQDVVGPFKRPRGRGPNGKVWNVDTGQWDDAAQSPDQSPDRKKNGKQKITSHCLDAMILKQLLDVCGKCPNDQDDPKFASNLQKFNWILNQYPLLVNAKDEESELTPLNAVLKAGVKGFMVYLHALLDRGATVDEGAVQSATVHTEMFTKLMGVDIVAWMKSKDMSGVELASASTSSQVLASSSYL